MSGYNQNIAFISSSTSWGGLEMNLVRWAKWLSLEGEEVKVFCQEGSAIHKRADELLLNVVFIQGHRKYYDFKAGYKLAKLLKSTNSGRVVFRDTKDMSVLALAKTFSSQKLKLFYFQGMRIGVSKRDWLHTIRFNRIDTWITPLHVLKEEVILNTKFPEHKIQVMPLAVDDSFQPEISASAVRESIGVKEDDILFGVVGRLDPGKCQDVVIKAFADLPDLSKAKLLIIGDETANSKHNYKQVLEQLISTNSLEHSIIMKPATSKVSNYMNALDVFIMSSESETFGMVTIEALWLDKIVIGTNSGGTRELLKKGEGGYLVEPKNVLELSQAMLDVLSDLSGYKNKALKSGEAARKKFSKKAFVNSLMKILTD